MAHKSSLIAVLILPLIFQTASAAEFIVKFKEPSRARQNLQILENENLNVVDRIPKLGMFVVNSSAKNPSLIKIQQRIEVDYIQPNNKLYTAETKPNDKRFGNQWFHKNVKSEKAWDITRGSKDIITAVIDTGISLNHEDLKNNIWKNLKEIPSNGIDDDNNGFIDDDRGWDFANNDNNPEDDQSHGSHCAGLVGAEGNNAIGGVGMNWNVKLMALKFIRASGSGSESDGIKAIIYAADNGAKIINASWGAEGSVQALKDSIAYANSKGVLFVAAAGNAKTNTDRKKFYPAGYDLPNIISVAASTSSNGKAEFSNFGKTSVHIAAPGHNIYSNSTKNSYDNKSGTSMAAPIVSGIAALILSVQPNLSVNELRNAVLNSAIPHKSWKDRVATGGIIQADLALQQLSRGSQIWPKKVSVKPGMAFNMTAFKVQSPIWSSANSNIASVDENGVVSGHTKGITQINFVDDGGATHTATVEVFQR